MAIEYIYIYMYMYNIYRSGYWQRSLVTESSKNTLFIHVISCFVRMLGTSFAEG